MQPSMVSMPLRWTWNGQFTEQQAAGSPIDSQSKYGTCHDNIIDYYELISNSRLLEPFVVYSCDHCNGWSGCFFLPLQEIKNWSTSDQFFFVGRVVEVIHFEITEMQRLWTWLGITRQVWLTVKIFETFYAFWGVGWGNHQFFLQNVIFALFVF